MNRTDQTFSFRQPVRALKAQADISGDGQTVRLAGYTAKRNEEPSGFLGLMHSWDIVAPSVLATDGAPALPGNRIVPEGGCFSRRFAIAVRARCAAREVLAGTRPSPLP